VFQFHNFLLDMEILCSTLQNSIQIQIVNCIFFQWGQYCSQPIQMACKLLSMNISSKLNMGQDFTNHILSHLSCESQSSEYKAKSLCTGPLQNFLSLYSLLFHSFCFDSRMPKWPNTQTCTCFIFHLSHNCKALSLNFKPNQPYCNAKWEEGNKHLSSMFILHF
jgi:hypothetical protein